MNTSKLDRALKKFVAAKEAAIKAGVPAALLDGSRVAGDKPEIVAYNRASKAVDRASAAAYKTHAR